MTPYLDTLGRMLASGIGTGAALMLLPSLLTAEARGETNPGPEIRLSAAFGLGIGMSIFLRTVNYSLDFSLFSEGGWAGWLLGLLLGYLVTLFDWQAEEIVDAKPRQSIFPAIGVIMVIALGLFVFSAPAVIARWAEADYEMVVGAVSALALLHMWVTLSKSKLLEKLSPTGLAIWNILFTLALTGTILSHRVLFPPTPDSPAVVVGVPTWLQQVPLALMLIFFPVIFVDLHVRPQRPLDRSRGKLMEAF